MIQSQSSAGHPSTAKRDTRTKKNVAPVANDDDDDDDDEVDGESKDENMGEEALILSSPLSSWAPTVLCVDDRVPGLSTSDIFT